MIYIIFGSSVINKFELNVSMVFISMPNFHRPISWAIHVLLYDLSYYPASRSTYVGSSWNVKIAPCTFGSFSRFYDWGHMRPCLRCSACLCSARCIGLMREAASRATKSEALLCSLVTLCLWLPLGSRKYPGTCGQSCLFQRPTLLVRFGCLSSACIKLKN